MASTVGQFITTKKLERLIKRNLDNPVRITQITHMYLALKEGLQGHNIKMKPIKDGIRLSIPHFGSMDVYIFDSVAESNSVLPLTNGLMVEPILPIYQNTRFNLPSFFHRHGDVYLDTSKMVELNQSNYSNNNFSVFNKEYVVSSVKTAIDYYSKRQYKNIPALRLKDEH